VRGCVYTHCHFDHCGGELHPMLTGGRKVPPLQGAKEVQQRGGTLWAGAGDVDEIRKQCKVEDLTALEDGDVLECGDLVLHALRTPGHSPGSICIFAAPQCLSPRGPLGGSGLEAEHFTKAESGLLITGDTLFVGSCGRMDLPGSDQGEMLSSLARLSTMDPEVVVLPGHNYAPQPFTTIGAERELNLMMQAGMTSVPKPLSLPPCCVVVAADLRRCGPRSLVVGRKVRLVERRAAARAAAAAAESSGAAGQQQQPSQHDTGRGDEERIAVLQEFRQKEGEYVVKLLPGGEALNVEPDGVLPLTKPSNL